MSRKNIKIYQNLKFINDMLDYWNNFYKDGKALSFCSSFCEECISQIKPSSTIIELGCGNGRDSIALANKAKTLYAVDVSQEALKKIKNINKNNIIPVESDFSDPNWNIFDISNGEKVDYVYNRFLLHAVNEGTQIKILEQSIKIFKAGIMIECRSADSEDFFYEHDKHDRWPVNASNLLKEIQGLKLNYSIQHKNDLAIYKQENPKILRINIQK